MKILKFLRRLLFWRSEARLRQESIACQEFLATVSNLLSVRRIVPYDEIAGKIQQLSPEEEIRQKRLAALRESLNEVRESLAIGLTKRSSNRPKEVY